MRVVEEQVVFTCQLDAHALDLIVPVAAKLQHFDTNCFKGAYIGGTTSICVLNA